jgi:SAM-dependent methyltransferase
MHNSLLDILVDPISKSPLDIEVTRSVDDHITEGTLRGSDARTYVITDGIPRFVLTEDRAQKQTEGSFGFKWQQRDTYNSPQMFEACQQWIVERYGFKSIDEMRVFFGSRRRVLDAGCGGGFSSSLWMNESWQGEGQAQWFGADISEAVDVARERLGAISGTHFIQADILQLPFRERTFDTFFSDGVLHHTPSTERALKSLSSLLEPDGQALFYVYRKKAPLREFADDHIRDAVSQFPPEEAWAMLRPLTKLGQALAELKAEVEVPEDIPYLGIKAGRYDVQRLIYWHVMKLYWNESFPFEENNHVNFDWYHPRYASRHTEEEIRRWCDEAGLSITHFDTQESGFSVRAIKN